MLDFGVVEVQPLVVGPIGTSAYETLEVSLTVGEAGPCCPRYKMGFCMIPWQDTVGTL